MKIALWEWGAERLHAIHHAQSELHHSVDGLHHDLEKFGILLLRVTMFHYHIIFLLKKTGLLLKGYLNNVVQVLEQSLQKKEQTIVMLF